MKGYSIIGFFILSMAIVLYLSQSSTDLYDPNTSDYPLTYFEEDPLVTQGIFDVKRFLMNVCIYIA